MEKVPEFRTVGGGSIENKEKARIKIERALSSHFESLSKDEQEQLRKFEREKSKLEIALINFANEETSRLMAEAGMEPHEIPIENFHIVQPELFEKVRTSKTSHAVANYRKQGVVFDDSYFKDYPLIFGVVAFHETLHLKSHYSIEVEDSGSSFVQTGYRNGVSAESSQKKFFEGNFHEHFVGLHEAIVAEAERRFAQKLIERPEFEKEKEWMSSSEVLETINKIAKLRGLTPDDIIWIGRKEENKLVTASYRTQREVLNYVCSEIQKQFPDQYQEVDDVYEVFLNAHFTGRLLQIARLVEGTFGEGSFRLLGNMGVEMESGVLHLESLKKARLKQTKEKTGGQ